MLDALSHFRLLEGQVRCGVSEFESALGGRLRNLNLSLNLDFHDPYVIAIYIVST